MDHRKYHRYIPSGRERESGGSGRERGSGRVDARENSTQQWVVQYSGVYGQDCRVRPRLVDSSFTVPHAHGFENIHFYCIDLNYLLQKSKIKICYILQSFSSVCMKETDFLKCLFIIHQ